MTIQTFKTKPVFLEGIFLTEESNIKETVQWIEANAAQAVFVKGVDEERAENGEISVRSVPSHIRIVTKAGGEMDATFGMWLLKDENDDFYGFSNESIPELFENVTNEVITA